MGLFLRPKLQESLYIEGRLKREKYMVNDVCGTRSGDRIFTMLRARRSNGVTCRASPNPSAKADLGAAGGCRWVCDKNATGNIVLLSFTRILTQQIRTDWPESPRSGPA